MEKHTLNMNTNTKSLLLKYYKDIVVVSTETCDVTGCVVAGARIWDVTWCESPSSSAQLTRSSKPVRTHPVPTVTRVITRSSAKKEPPEIPWWVGLVRIYCAKLRHLVPEIPSNFHGIHCFSQFRGYDSPPPPWLCESLELVWRLFAFRR